MIDARKRHARNDISRARKWLLAGFTRAGITEVLVDSLNQQVPWLWHVVAWAIAIIGLLLVAATPAYFVFYPIATTVRRSLKAWLSQIRSRREAVRENRCRALGGVIEDFRINSGIVFLSKPTNRMEIALASFSDITTKLKPEFARVQDAHLAFERMGKKLAEVVSKPTPVLPNCPTVDQLASVYGGLRTAKVRLFVSSVILVALISVNTGMLGQILKDLGFIPHDLAYFGIPLYLVFAFFLTLVEAGFGYVHTASRPGPDEPSRVPVWPTLAFCFAVGIGCVEGFFYSQVAPSKDSLVDLPFGLQIKQGMLFFMWGMILVMVLFGLGTIWSTSLERITGSAGHFPALTAQLARHYENIHTACATANTSTSRLREEVETVQRGFQSAAKEAASLVASVAQLKEATPGGGEKPLSPLPLTTAEVYHFTNLSGLWLVLTLLGMSAVTAGGFYAIEYSFPALVSNAALVVSFGLAVCFLVLGLILPRDVLLLDGTGNRRHIVSGSLWRGTVASVFSLIILVAFVALLWRAQLSRSQAALWIAVLVIGTALVAATSQTGATGKGLRICLRRLGNALTTLLEALLSVFVWLLLAAVYCAECIALALAAPIFLLRGRELPSLHTMEEIKRQAVSARGAS